MAWQPGIPCHPAGTQLSQLTLDPPWTPVFQTEMVMLTCRGSSMPGHTYWYINNRLWWQEGSDRIRASKDYPGSGSYQCRGPGAELSPPITLSFSNGEGQDWCSHLDTCRCPQGSGWAPFHSLLPLM